MEPNSYYKQFITLLATDSPADWLSDTLLTQNATLILAVTKQEAISALNNRQFNLILIDDALDAKTIISSKAVNGINANTPSLALIVDDNSSQRKRLVAAGFDDCLTKPLTSANLIEAISFWRDYDRSSPYSYQDSIQKLLTNCRNNRKLAITLYDKLFTTLPEHLNLIEDALKHGDYQLALDTAHKLNGAVKTCYLLPICHITNSLESNLMAEKLDLVDDCFLTLKQSIKAFIEQREQILNYLANPVPWQ